MFDVVGEGVCLVRKYERVIFVAMDVLGISSPLSSLCLTCSVVAFVTFLSIAPSFSSTM